MRFVRWIEAPRTQIWFNGLGTIAWVALLPVALVTNLKVSLIYVVVMSQWANIATHAGAWVASLVNAQAAHIIEHHPDLPPIKDKAG